MKKTKINLEKSAVTFNSMDKKEMQKICGGGKFVFDAKTKTFYYIVGG
jgi:hypothetical protein